MTDDAKKKLLTCYFDEEKTILMSALEAEVPYDEAKETIFGILQERASAKTRSAKYPVEVIRGFLDAYDAGLSIKDAAEKVSVPYNTARDWLRPTLSKAETLMAAPPVQDALIGNALKMLARDDQRDARLNDYRGNLAEDLYKKAKRLWELAMGKAEMERIPHQELKALVAAAHYAVKDAQLLGGQPTERVENIFSELDKLSDEDLAAFVGLDPVELREGE